MSTVLGALSRTSCLKAEFAAHEHSGKTHSYIFFFPEIMCHVFRWIGANSVQQVLKTPFWGE